MAVLETLDAATTFQLAPRTARIKTMGILGTEVYTNSRKRIAIGVGSRSVRGSINSRAACGRKGTTIITETIAVAVGRISGTIGIRLAGATSLGVRVTTRLLGDCSPVRAEALCVGCTRYTRAISHAVVISTSGITSNTSSIVTRSSRVCSATEWVYANLAVLITNNVSGTGAWWTVVGSTIGIAGTSDTKATGMAIGRG